MVKIQPKEDKTAYNYMDMFTMVTVHDLSGKNVTKWFL